MTTLTAFTILVVLVGVERLAELEIVVVDVDRRPVEGATIRSPGGRPVAAGPGRYLVRGVTAGRIEILVRDFGTF